MKNANLLLSIGSTMYEKTKNLIFFGPAGLALLLITAVLCGEYAWDYLLMNGHYFIVNVWVFLCYALILIGSCVVWPYFMGLLLIGIGQIAKNTSGEEQSVVSKTNPVTKPVVSATSTTGSGNWICSSCGKENNHLEISCQKCGVYR